MSSPASILILCADNLTLSPVAETILKSKLPHTCVSSAGFECKSSNGRQFDAEMLAEADLVFVMTNVQKQKIESKYRETRGRVYRLGEWDNLDIETPAQIEQACASWVHKFTPLR